MNQGSQPDEPDQRAEDIDRAQKSPHLIAAGPLPETGGILIPFFFAGRPHFNRRFGRGYGRGAIKKREFDDMPSFAESEEISGDDISIGFPFIS